VTDQARAAAVAAAVERIQPGMTIGLGSGRAVFALVEAIGARWGPRPPLRAAVASERTASLVRAAGIELVELDGTRVLDLALDGADELDGQLDLIKGGGGALLREKLVALAAARLVVVAEAAKLVERLGARHTVPVEVVRFGWADTRRRLLGLVPAAVRRAAPDGHPVVTDEGHYLLDCTLPADGLGALAAAVKGTVGVVEHGLFLGLAAEALLGRPDGGLLVLSRPAGQPAPGAGPGPGRTR
jgi:ribose 5-phosphate isomerase A